MVSFQLLNAVRYIPVHIGLHKRKHLFIHIPKNGGMSIRRAPQLEGRLLTATRKRLISTQYANEVSAIIKKGGTHHARLIDIDRSVRRASIPFAVVRNPWSRVFSRFTFGLQGDQGGSEVRDISAADFERFVDERHEYGDKPYFWHKAIRGWYPQADYVLDEKGDVGADVLRFEKLQEDFQTYFKAEEPLRPRNRTKRKKVCYKNFYSDKLIQDVADWYSRDIELFGFDFEGGARKNTFAARMTGGGNQ